MGGTAGTTYTVTVIAHSAGGDSAPGSASGPVTPTAPQPPAAPPATDLTLTTDKGLITNAVPGQNIVFIGTGFAPYSTVTITVYSTPTVLGTVVTDANGNFSKAIVVPPDLVAGAHTAVAQGIAPDGTDRAMNLAITVATAAPPARAPGHRQGILAITGPAVLTIVQTGVILVIGGIALIATSRPRRRNPYCNRGLPGRTR